MLLMICRKYKNQKRIIFTRLLYNFTWLSPNKIQMHGRPFNCNAWSVEIAPRKAMVPSLRGKGWGHELNSEKNTVP